MLVEVPPDLVKNVLQFRWIYYNCQFYLQLDLIIEHWAISNFVNYYRISRRIMQSIVKENAWPASRFISSTNFRSIFTATSVQIWKFKPFNTCTVCACLHERSLLFSCCCKFITWYHGSFLKICSSYILSYFWSGERGVKVWGGVRRVVSSDYTMITALPVLVRTVCVHSLFRSYFKLTIFLQSCLANFLK